MTKGRGASAYLKVVGNLVVYVKVMMNHMHTCLMHGQIVEVQNTGKVIQGVIPAPIQPQTTPNYILKCYIKSTLHSYISIIMIIYKYILSL